ncbi:MAG: gliding motility-associated C-terminal domain-containing protein [Bacteroidota bacterium]
MLRCLSLCCGLALCVIPLASQSLCEGSLGENIFEDGNFGSGPLTILPTNPGIAPGYTYTTSTPPNDGFYLLTNNMAEWPFNHDTWLDISDNSPDPDGYMMVVNASFSPGVFYEQTVDGLCDNTLYEFSADLINLIRNGVPNHILPQVDFLLDDVVQYSSGPIPQSEQWNKYGFTFSLPTGQNSVKLTLINRAPGGIGNDIALDNISFQPCGPSSFINTDELIFLCEEENNPATLTADLDLGIYDIQWQQSLDEGLTWTDIPGATNQQYIHTNFETGLYYYRYLSAGSEANLSNPKCRVLSNWVILEVLPIRYAIVDTFCMGYSYDFNGLELDVPGNYVDSLISSRGCDSIVLLDLAEVPYPDLLLDLEGISPPCFNEASGSIQLNDIDGGYAPYIFTVGDDSNSSGNFLDLAPGTYDYDIIDRHGCVYEDEVSLGSPSILVLSLPPDTLIPLGSGVPIIPNTNFNINAVNWSPVDYLDCLDCFDNVVYPGQDITYTLTVADDFGCQVSDSIQVRVSRDVSKVYIPNAFSPNGDGWNDTFYIGSFENLVQQTAELAIFDRWGGLIFNRTNFDLTLPSEGWDGTTDGQPAQVGVYAYFIKVRLIDGTIKQFAGDLTLLR